MFALTSTRWLSGPYRSLSSSITRLLKNEENFFFCLPGWNKQDVSVSVRRAGAPSLRNPQEAG